MATKAQHTQFNRNVAAYLQSIGAEQKKMAVFASEWTLKTIAGDLYLSLHEPERSEVFSLFCRFDDVEKAKTIIPTHAQLLYKDHTMNGYSGKWNFHSYDAKELLEEFKEQIEPLLINEKV